MHKEAVRQKEENVAPTSLSLGLDSPLCIVTQFAIADHFTSGGRSSVILRITPIMKNVLMLAIVADSPPPAPPQHSPWPPRT